MILEIRTRLIPETRASEPHLGKPFTTFYVACEIMRLVWVLVKVVHFLVNGVLLEVSNILPTLGTKALTLGDVPSIEEVLAEELRAPTFR